MEPEPQEAFPNKLREWIDRIRRSRDALAVVAVAPVVLTLLVALGAQPLAPTYTFPCTLYPNATDRLHLVTPRVVSDVEFDFPIDPITDLLVLKTAEVDKASIGDFVRYRVASENRAASAASVRIPDALPEGFRYQKGSTRFAGAGVADPQILANGKTLIFTLGLIPAGTTAELSYVAEIASGAGAGAAVNRAQAVSQSGTPISNRPEAMVDVGDDFFR